MEATKQSKISDWYGEHRRYLLAVAYRMLGSYSEAEDVVHDVFVRLQSIPASDIRDARSYLTKMTVRRSLDVLKSARRRRVRYVGPWLPEPDAAPIREDVSDTLILEETIGYALLVAMERLTPGERAVFLLHEVFGFGYPDTAETLGKNEQACRKAMSRAKNKLARELPEQPMELRQERELTMRFLQAANSGNVQALLDWIEKDAVCISDGGGIVTAAVRPIEGHERIAAFLTGLATRFRDEAMEVIPLMINGRLGVGFKEDGIWSSLVVVSWRGGKADRIYMVRNPHKLARLPV